MNEYKIYPEYRDSGVEWLGDIPKHWKVSKIKYLFKVETGGTPLLPFDKEGIPWVKPTNLNEFNPILQTEKHVSKTGIVGIPIIPKNSILVCGIGTVGKFGISGTAVITNQQINSFIPLKTIGIAYSKYLISSSKEELELTANKVVIAISNKTAMQNVYLCSPSYKESETIAAFLDYETGKIDKLIQKQEELIVLLEEKRRAIISHAVTKGLDSTVPMKESGIEWIGKIPKHWKVKKLKYLCDIKTGNKNTVNANSDGKYPFYVRSQNIERINTYTENREAVLTAGDGVGVGKVFHYINGKFDYHQRVYMLHNFKGMNGLFCFYYLFSLFAKVALDGVAKSTVDSLRLPTFLNFFYSLPPISEQQTIVSFLDYETGKIDNLIIKAKTAIELMLERRTALISAAVTGKIDIRNFKREL